jgi:hypothetical protein
VVVAPFVLWAIGAAVTFLINVTATWERDWATPVKLLTKCRAGLAARVMVANYLGAFKISSGTPRRSISYSVELPRRFSE